jgi:hypothetical protein
MPSSFKLDENQMFGIFIFLLFCLLLYVLFNPKNAFSNILNSSGATLYEGEKNSVDITVTYSTPAPVALGYQLYKWPILYLFEPPTGVNAANLPDAYTNPKNTIPPQTLATQTPTTGYARNLINLTNLLGSAGPNPGISGSDGATAYNATYTLTISGSSRIINTYLQDGKKYILGIALQLDKPYLNLSNNASLAQVSPLNYRYGAFSFVDVTYNILTGLTVVLPGAPTVSGITFGTLSI